MTERVQTRDDVASLASRILTRRQRPLVVVSTDPLTDGFALDVDQLTEDVHDIADIVLISTGDLTRELDSLLPDKTQVYGGAGRSYPVDFQTDPDWRRSPLRFPSARATRLLVDDVLGQAAAAGLFERRSARRVEASGVVKGFAAGDSRAIVDVEGRGLATISRELTYPPVPLQWSLRKGQRVTGTFDLDTKLLLVERPAPTTAELAEAFPHRCVTLALVAKVTAARATLQLHPGVGFTLRRADVSSNPLDTVDLLVAEGDVVAARVSHLSDGTLHLALTDVDDDEPLVPSLALTADGPPWLEEGRTLELQTTDAADDLAALDEAAAASAREPGGETDAAATTPARSGGRAGADARGGTTAASVLPTAPDAPEASDAAEAPDAAHAPASPRPVPGPGPRTVAHTAGPPAPAAPPLGAPVSTSQASAAADQVPSAAPGAALHSTQLSLEAARRRNDELERRLAEVGADDASLTRLRARVSAAEARVRDELAERGRLEHELAGLREQRRQSTQALREARRSAPATVSRTRDDRRARWATDDEWVRHEVYLAWVERVAAGERQTWPLGEIALGAEFAASLEILDDGQFDKATRAVVDAATDRIREIASRRLHPLREGDGATAADVVRADGAKCYRASIEQNTPGARRLHYWALPGGGIELSRVVTHDDMRP